MPSEAMHFEQMRREQEYVNRSGGATPNWAGEFAQHPPQFLPEDFAQQRSSPAGFSSQDFANFRAQQAQPGTATPPYQQSSLQPRSMYGPPMSSFGMQGPMAFGGQYMHQPEESYLGKGKGRVQELSDTDWEKQFQELSTQDKQDEDLDREAEEAMERELNQMDR